MSKLKALPETALPQLRGNEKRKNPELAAVYQVEIAKLEQAGYALKLDPDKVEKS